MPQLLKCDGKLDYLVFDLLAEAAVAMLGRRVLDKQGVGYVEDFVDHQVVPHLAEILQRKIRVIGNAGALDPVGCGERLRRSAEALGLKPKIAVITGDNLCDRMSELVTSSTRDMFDGSDIAMKAASADRVLSLTAYTGAFAVAAALEAGADVVIAGRCVDSAPTLGALIHEFGWQPNDFDLLASGTLAGHLVECSTQVTGGTFTDWEEVPRWEEMGFPIVECTADGGIVITKPPGTGGLVSVGAVAEQMLYEIGDTTRYVVPDVVSDFSNVHLTQEGQDRVRLQGAKGWGRTGTYKVVMTYDRGWRGQALFPVLGRNAVAKAKRIGDALVARTRSLLRDAQLPDWEGTQVDVVGAHNGSFDEAIVRIVVDHADVRGAQLLAREQMAIGTVVVGLSLSLGVTTRPIQWINSFLVSKSQIPVAVSVDGEIIPFNNVTDAVVVPGRPIHAQPPAPSPFQDPVRVQLLDLAWARSGDKGDLFNVAVIARRPEFLPYISAVLTPQAVSQVYAARLSSGKPLAVTRYEAPGCYAMNFEVAASLEGGMTASRRLDPAAKSYAQMILDMPIPVPRAVVDGLPPTAKGATAH
jgi:hypothetical protein